MSRRKGQISHTADLGLWVEADSRQELFCAAAKYLSELIFEGPRNSAQEWRDIALQGDDLSDLFVQFLNEVVYLADATGFIVSDCRIAQLEPPVLRARLGLQPITDKHLAGQPVKAVTYHMAKVTNQKGIWRGEVFLDV